MTRTNSKKIMQSGVPNPANKVNSVHIIFIAHFICKFILPTLAVLWPWAIADIFSAYYDYMGIWP